MNKLSAQQQSEIEDFLSDYREREIDIKYIYSPYEQWCIDNGKELVIKETIRQWYVRGRKPTYSSTFYDYINFKNINNSDNPEQLIIRAVEAIFPSGQLDSTERLLRLVGYYKITRRDWTSERDEYIQCPVYIFQSRGITFYTEEEDFDTNYPVNERFRGYIFLFASSLWIIAREKDNACVKLLTVHDCTPPILTGLEKIQICRGNLIAVSGRGPNISHKFVLHRVQNKIVRTLTMSREQVKHDLRFDKLSYEYLCS